MYPIVDSLQENFFHGGQCGEEARASLQLTFYDAIGFSLSKGPSGYAPPFSELPVEAHNPHHSGGGADGSIMIFRDIESQYPANARLDDLVKAQAQLLSQFGGVISPGDLCVLLTTQICGTHSSFATCSIQLAGAVGVGNCPGAPQLQFLFGRPNATVPAPDTAIPAPSDSADVILARFADAGFTSDEVVALLASLVCPLIKGVIHLMGLATATRSLPPSPWALVLLLQPLILPRACSTHNSLWRYNSAIRKTPGQSDTSADSSRHSQARYVSSLMPSLLEVGGFHFPEQIKAYP